MVSKKRLPSEYQEVEWIQSTGKQWIDTLFTPNQDTKIDITFQSMSNKFGGTFFGSRISSGNSAYTTWQSLGNYLRDNYGSLNTNHLAANDMNIHHIIKDKNLLYYDDMLILNNNKQTFTCPGNCYLFALNENNIASYMGNYRIYGSVKIYDNDRMVRFFIPCYRKSDGEIGMYDTVSKTFFTNSGTGTFLKGADV